MQMTLFLPSNVEPLRPRQKALKAARVSSWKKERGQPRDDFDKLSAAGAAFLGARFGAATAASLVGFFANLARAFFEACALRRFIFIE